MMSIHFWRFFSLTFLIFLHFLGQLDHRKITYFEKIILKFFLCKLLQNPPQLKCYETIVVCSRFKYLTASFQNLHRLLPLTVAILSIIILDTQCLDRFKISQFAEQFNTQCKSYDIFPNTHAHLFRLYKVH